MADAVTVLEKQFKQGTIRDVFDFFPIGVSLATDSSCREIIHNTKAAHFLRTAPFTSLSPSTPESLLPQVYHKGKKVSDAEMPLQRSAWLGETLEGFEAELLWDDGVAKTGIWSSRPILAEDGTIIGAVATFEDITDRRQVDQKLIRHRDNLQTLVEERTWELQQKNENLAAILGSISDVCYALDKEWRLSFVNSGAAKLGFGLDTDCIGMKIWDRFPEWVGSKWEQIFHEAVATNEPVYALIEGVYTSAWYEASCYPNEQGLLVYVKDVTKQKKLESLLKESEILLRECLDHMSFSIIIVKPIWGENGMIADFSIEFVNQAGCREQNVSSQADLLGRNLLEVWPGKIEKLFEQYCRVYTTGEPFVDGNLEYHDAENEHQSGTYETQVFKIRDGIVAWWRDITEKMKFEADIARLDRLNTVGELAASIGHEVRNPLTTVRGYLQMFQHREKNAEHRRQFTTMIEELDRANFIISEFLSLAKNKTVEIKRDNLNDVISILMPLLQADAFHSGHDIRVEMGEIPDCDLDEKEVRQLLLNLVRNGLEAAPYGGTVTIQSYTEMDKIVLAVHDTGRGIPSEIFDKLGTPFLTTKENGTGLGLAMCYRIAERHGARIEVKTSPQGTAFLIKFPAVGY